MDLELKSKFESVVGKPFIQFIRPGESTTVDTTVADLYSAIVGASPDTHPRCPQCGVQVHNASAHNLSTVHLVATAPKNRHLSKPLQVDENSTAVRYMVKFGWSIGDQGGLGASRTGRREPILAKKKPDKSGIGHVRKEGQSKAAKKQTLSHKQIRQLDLETKQNQAAIMRKLD